MAWEGGQLRGLRYLNEKEPHGGDRGNQYTKEARDQNDPLAKTAKKIADQTGPLRALTSFLLFPIFLATISADRPFDLGRDSHLRSACCWFGRVPAREKQLDKNCLVESGQDFHNQDNHFPLRENYLCFRVLLYLGSRLTPFLQEFPAPEKSISS